MKQSISSTFLYNIIIIFIILVFAVLAATLSYFKAFKVNSRIINALEKYEGYNHLSKAEIDQTLSTIGYQVGNSENCQPTRDKGAGILKQGLNFPTNPTNENFNYCIYLYKNDVPTNYGGRNTYYSYEVVSYITFDFPIINQFKVPIHNRSARIFKFNDGQGE